MMMTLLRHWRSDGAHDVVAEVVREPGEPKKRYVREGVERVDPPVGVNRTHGVGKEVNREDEEPSSHGLLSVGGKGPQCQHQGNGKEEAVANPAVVLDIEVAASVS